MYRGVSCRQPGNYPQKGVRGDRNLCNIPLCRTSSKRYRSTCPNLDYFRISEHQAAASTPLEATRERPFPSFSSPVEFHHDESVSAIWTASKAASLALPNASSISRSFFMLPFIPQSHLISIAAWKPAILRCRVVDAHTGPLKITLPIFEGCV
jgi:hypothetical protein